jgi:hypothetical protein
MTSRVRFLGAVFAGLVAIAFAAPKAGAVIDNKDQRKCVETVAKAGGNYIKGHLKEVSKCIDKNLKATGSCDPVADRDPKLAKAESKLRKAIDGKCGVAKFSEPAASLKFVGYPGKCPDPDPSDGFTDDDLENCIFETHRDVSDALIRIQYGSNGVDPVTQLPATPVDLGKCQAALSKAGQKQTLAVLKEIQKCRNGLNSGKLSGFVPEQCAAQSSVAAKILKAESKTRAAITGKCTNAHIAALDIDPDGACTPPVTDASSAAECIVATHTLAIDNPDNSGSPDVIDVEYAAQAFCGDNIVNDPLQANITSLKLGFPPEECDGTDDSMCPGQCGAPGTDFACLCTNMPRQRVIEHENADLDNGWTGQSHDSGIVEGGGYIIDLYDCDGPGGSDPICTVGPSCNNPPNQACVSDANCPGVGNFCRKKATAVGPHCNGDIQKPCTTDAQCPPAGVDFCRKTPHGPPLPLSAGGVSVCVINIFSEDIVGTTNLDTGAGDVRIRQSSLTHLASGTINQPCPTCGGFCNGTAGAGGGSPGTRTLCQSDADCPLGVQCVMDAICSYGPNINQACRPNPPFGNSTALFGNPSVDCPPNPGSNISGGGLDILFAPATTGTTTVTPNFACPPATGYNFRTCIAGTNLGKTCTSGADCPGAPAGSCREQCFCPGTGGAPQQPNACVAACVGGANDSQPCGSDVDCDPPNGFCHQGDCRVNPLDMGSTQEGACTAGPNEGVCSFTTIKGCGSNADCGPPGCDFCQSGETCVFRARQCFVNSGIVRTGTPGVPDRVAAAQFCIAATSSPAVNSTAGIPGPGALLQPATVVTTGLP